MVNGSELLEIAEYLDEYDDFYVTGYECIFMDNDFKIITRWLQNIGAINEGKLDNLAYFYLDAIESALSKKDRLNKFIPPHSYYATYFEKGIKGTAGLYIDDI